MKQIKILDCTLRDGGYINNFSFGEDIIIDIIDGLSKASIDIIECGFLRSGYNDKDKTVFSTVEDIGKCIIEKNYNSLYVAMIQYGAIGIDEISQYDGRSIDGIRISFHEYEIEPAFNLAKQLVNKGYKVFIQPVGTTSYEDIELIELINRVNELKPYAFYIVDTLGKMYKKDLLRTFYIIDHNLDKKIAIGFHSHNNLQMSFANAQELTQIDTDRDMIIDSSILGMGRGAGNLNTELLAQYLNVNKGLKYDVFKIMNIMDQYIKPLSITYKWGYDAAYYLAAIMGCHPNYASFLLNTQTLQIIDIGSILNGLDIEKRHLFDKEYIQSEYAKFMNYFVDDTDACSEIRKTIGDKKVVLLAPGKSFERDIKKLYEINTYKNCFIISINFIPKEIHTDLTFISNRKRFFSLRKLLNSSGQKAIITSNIDNLNKDFLIVNYSSYLNEESCIIDNAGIMCINLLKKIGIKDFLLVGFDGFSESIKDNFSEKYMIYEIDEKKEKTNIAIANKIRQLRKHIRIKFMSPSLYDIN